MTTDELHKQDIERWKQLRAAARQAKERATSLVMAFKQAEQNAAQHELNFEEVQQAIQAHGQTQPLPENFPTDEEMQAWEQQGARLQAALVPIRERLRNLREAREQARYAAIAADDQLRQAAYAESAARIKALGEDKNRIKWADIRL